MSDKLSDRYQYRAVIDYETICEWSKARTIKEINKYLELGYELMICGRNSPSFVMVKYENKTK